MDKVELRKSALFGGLQRLFLEFSTSHKILILHIRTNKEGASEVQTLFTAREVQQILQVSIATLYRMHDAGILRAVEIVHGRRKRLLRWRPEAIEKFIASRETKTQRA